MKRHFKSIIVLAFWVNLVPLVVQAQNAVPFDVQSAQQRVWDVQLHLNNAKYRLAILKLDLQKNKLSEDLLKANQKKDIQQAARITAQLQNIEHSKQLERQRLDLLGQILIVDQQGNKPMGDSLRLTRLSLRKQQIEYWREGQNDAANSLQFQLNNLR